MSFFLFSFRTTMLAFFTFVFTLSAAADLSSPKLSPKKKESLNPSVHSSISPFASDPTDNWDERTPHLEAGSLVKGESVLFVTHAASIWDTHSVIEYAVNNRVIQARTHHIPIIYLVDDDSSDNLKYYYLKHRPDYLIVSDSGRHEIRTEGNTLYFAGGFFNLCAGETARDALLFSSIRSDHPTLRANFLSDSIFTFDGRTLKASTKDLSDINFIEWLSMNYFLKCELGQQNYSLNRHCKFDDFTFKILRDGKRIGNLGTGARPVELNFIINGLAPGLD